MSIASCELEVQNAIIFTTQSYSAVTLICLRDKFDFTNEQLEELAEHIGAYFDNIMDGHVPLEEVVKALKEETGIDVMYTPEAVTV
jgi:hypothetical protein